MTRGPQGENAVVSVVYKIFEKAACGEGIG